MMIDVSAETIISIAVPAAGLIFGLYGRSLQTKNEALQTQINLLSEQHEREVERLDDMNTKIWTEIKCQMDASARNSEAIIKLLGSIDRLNEILTRMDNSLNSKVSTDMCNAIRQSYPDLRRRHDDPKEA